VPQIRPFAAVRYSKDLAGRLSDLIAPPYDVLDESGKAALIAKHPNNIVVVDLPHLPPKSVGPDSAYQAANQTLQRWLTTGVLTKDHRPSLYPYAQTYSHGTRSFHRRGFFALVKLSPFGQGHVVPHEKTYPEAITDRLKLTRATRTQLSPIFGLFSDPDNHVTGKLFAGLGKPVASATLDGVQNDLWSVHDSTIHNAILDAMKSNPVYIADGHHRYTMALQYQKESGNIPPDHPANFALFDLVSMQDDGLLILPTHRIIGGLTNFDPARLSTALGTDAQLIELSDGSQDVAHFAEHVLPTRPPQTFGLFDGARRKLFELRILNPDILAKWEPNQSPSWRSLDVAILQRYLLDEVLTPAFAPSGQLTKSYTADPKQIVPMTDGTQRQVALILKPTPLKALEELGKHNEVMPQKSTYFFPKLATGMVLNQL
jgi:uncharacterized protein (DUF1015 family)